mmetsp:Transcript_154136/g.295754  ORF Transcript_154136/g.295754 Transcript_154136/m.295754 type:complete len:308 (+) Transcript_154136:135-1058(+)
MVILCKPERLRWQDLCDHCLPELVLQGRHTVLCSLLLQLIMEIDTAAILRTYVTTCHILRGCIRPHTIPESLQQGWKGDLSWVVDNAHGLGVASVCATNILIARFLQVALRVSHFGIHNASYALKGELHAPEAAGGERRVSEALWRFGRGQELSKPRELDIEDQSLPSQWRICINDSGSIIFDLNDLCIKPLTRGSQLNLLPNPETGRHLRCRKCDDELLSTLTVRLLRWECHCHLITYFHTMNCSVEARDHLASAYREAERCPACRRIEDAPIFQAALIIHPHSIAACGSAVCVLGGCCSHHHTAA